MQELEILQQRFNEMATQFPGLIHILTVRPKNKKEPKLRPAYMPNKDNLLIIWGHGLVRKHKPERNMKHWLIKPHHESWNNKDASENLRNLAEKAGRVFLEKGFLDHFKLSEHILKLSQYKLNNNRRVQFWVLIVHELGNAKRCVSEWPDIKTSLLHDLHIKGSGKKPIQAYHEILKDFFLESSLVISKLLQIEKEIASQKDATIIKSEKCPDDLITLVVAGNNYHISRITLLRAIKDGRLRSYRPDNCAKNHLHMVSESQVASYWPAKKG
ncbi:MAG: hypothetical protein FVQ85_11590 [Planctomycetes bacterium]|nr:hypothetical protein [Planctomycetota bacterium]